MNQVRRVLIANRGEIACRIGRACREAGLESVAVYSDADRDALHVETADAAIHIGPSPAAKSYLDVRKLLAAAHEAGADAVHPGYGFLSESAPFAEAVEAAGLTWIGPRPACLRAMGDKLNARDLAARAGLPVLPGVSLQTLEAAALAQEAARVGFPLLLKAAGGGGGIGMQRIASPDELAAAAARLTGLAERAFGNGVIYLEKLIPHARHVEVQVFGDGEGGAIHLYERDCSLQRRYQKIVEEAPAPTLSPDLRRDLCEAAVKLTARQRYAGAGTVEFLVDAEMGDFFFLEMNTRIQVEHGVTEMATGLDLVRMQLACAAGAWRLPLQDEVAIHAHALECRLYAEDPRRNFRPSPGRLEVLDLPRGDDIRIDTGCRAGDVITPFYDPMIAKVIVRGPTRAEALDRMAVTLGQVRIEGVASNLELLRALVVDPDFRAGQVDTGLAQRAAARLGVAAPPPVFVD